MARIASLIDYCASDDGSTDPVIPLRGQDLCEPQFTLAEVESVHEGEASRVRWAV
jgi:hypothetical protein